MDFNDDFFPLINLISIISTLRFGDTHIRNLIASSNFKINAHQC
jgi:hypothetical protein